MIIILCIILENVILQTGFFPNGITFWESDFPKREAPPQVIFPNWENREDALPKFFLKSTAECPHKNSFP